MGFWNSRLPYDALRLANHTILVTLNRDSHPLRVSLKILGFHVGVVICCARRDYVYGVQVIEPDYSVYETAKIKIILKHLRERRPSIDLHLTADSDLDLVGPEAAYRSQMSDDPGRFSTKASHDLQEEKELSPLRSEDEFDGQELNIVLPWPGIFLEGDRIPYEGPNFKAVARSFTSEGIYMSKWPRFGCAEAPPPEAQLEFVP